MRNHHKEFTTIIYIFTYIAIIIILLLLPVGSHVVLQTALIALLFNQYELAILSILTQMVLFMILIRVCWSLRFLVYVMLFGFSPVYLCHTIFNSVAQRGNFNALIKGGKGK